MGAAAGLVLTVALLLRLPGLVPWALALAGAEYASFLYVGDTAAEVAPAYAAGLVLVAELSYWALESLSARDSARALLARGLRVLATALAGGALGLLIAAIAAVSVSGGLAVEAAGLAAAALAVGLVARLARAKLLPR